MRVALATTALAACLALAGCQGDEEPRPQRASSIAEWVSYDNASRGYSVKVPPGWHRAERSLTPHYTDPVEILVLASFPLRAGERICGNDGGGALARVRPDGVLVTVQERGRGAYGGSDFPPRPERFRPDPDLPGQSTWPYCAAGHGEPPVPMLDYWFGFSDAGRAFHVLVAVGKSAPEERREAAFRILDSLRFDPAAKPDWEAAG